MKPQLWRGQCVMSRGQNQYPMDNYHNACVALESDPDIKDALMFNEFSQSAMLTHVIDQPLQQHEPRPVTDDDIGMVQKWLQLAGLRLMSFDNTARAIEHQSRAHPYHPVRDYLNGLRWDGIDRNGRWLHLYCGADDSEANKQFGALFLISMVARIMEPGCKADYMLVLEGDQGIEKSKVCRILGEPWFSDTMPDLAASAKDSSIHLRGKWICEIPELHAFNRAETTLLKSFISRQSEFYRPPYGRKEVEEPRQCLFMGTTNKSQYLKDETGARRFWPVRTGVFNLDGLKDSRDQMMAQAVADYVAGKNWWPTREDERKYFMPLQADRYDADDGWEEPISSFLNGQSETTFSDILDVLEFSTGNGKSNSGMQASSSPDHKTPINRLSKTDQNRIKAILTKLGWERGSRNSAGRQLWIKS